MNVNGIVEEHEWQSGLYDCCSGWDSTTLCMVLTPPVGLSANGSAGLLGLTRSERRR